MPVNTGNNGNNESGKQTPASGSVFGDSLNRNTGAQGTQSQASAPRGRGIGRLSSLRTGMGRKRPAADLEAMKTGFIEEFKSFTNASVIAEAQNTRLIMIDRNQIGKKVDLLVAVLPISKDGQTHAAIHTVLVEDANDDYEPTTFQVGGKPSRYTTVVGDVYTKELWGQIVDIVSQQAGLKIVPYDAGHQTLPAETDVKDKDVIHKVAFFVSEALTRTAMSSILQTTADIVSLADLGDNTQASAKIDFRSVDDKTAAGLPIRTDFAVKLHYSEQTPQGVSQTEKAFDLDSQIPLGGAEGFIDLTYVAPPQAGFGQQQATQHYFARAILTRLDTDQDIITPELQMLSLLGSTLIARNLNWGRVWSPQFRGINKVDLHDIGAIGYELPGPDGVPAGVPVETNTAAFDDAQLARLLMTAVHDKPIISIDVEESGELSWLNRVLLDAAEGSAEANNSIVNALDNLTNGNFSNNWKGGQIVVDDNNRIHLGYYMDEAGVRRDVRALDYLMVLNSYATIDPQMIIRWQATFDNLDVDAQVRLADREDMIRKILGPTVHFTGYARRVNFAPDVLDYALEAAGEAGLRIRPENTLIGFGQTSVRGRQDLSSLTFGGQAGRGVFTYGQGAGGGRNFARPYTGRGGWR